MKFVTLWSDILVYGLLLVTVFFIFSVFNNKDLRQTWRNILYRPINMVACILLFSYIVIGVLDTIHFEDTSQTRITTHGIASILDKMLTPLILNTEKTYSAPFATHSFVKEATVLPTGELIRDYPKLNFGGAHLNNQSKWQDIRNTLIQIVLQTLIIWAAFCVILLTWHCYRRRLAWDIYVIKVLKGKTQFPWRSFLLCVGFVMLTIFFIHGFMWKYHILGTNAIGEDVLYQSLKSIRTGLIIGTITTLITLPFAILFGLMAGYFKGWIDDVIQYIYTTLSSIPAVLLIAAAVLMLQVVMSRHSDWFSTVAQRTDARLLALCAILGITSWTTLCRLLRGETLKISQMDFVLAARSLGLSHIAIILKHLLPNVMHIILITVVLDFSGLVLAEAVLSYVGVGVDPTSYSWGTMINSARLEMARVPAVWWSLTAAFIFMFVLVLSANIFSDAIRDAFDPRSNLGLFK
ncbi:MAG: ABC transporter permease [Proteobacteria bacterium]|nr:ABC transporter permease [Pseudomonadota bacterium]